MDEFLEAAEEQRRLTAEELEAADRAWSKILAGMDKDVLAWHRQVDMIFLNFSKGGEMAISDLCNSFKIMG